MKLKLPVARPVKIARLVGGKSKGPRGRTTVWAKRANKLGPERRGIDRGGGRQWLTEATASKQMMTAEHKGVEDLVLLGTRNLPSTVLTITLHVP